MPTFFGPFVSVHSVIPVGTVDHDVITPRCSTEYWFIICKKTASLKEDIKESKYALPSNSMSLDKPEQLAMGIQTYRSLVI